jgi:hypothetical protein
VQDGAEVCDGKDNDCDGDTDEVAQACPLPACATAAACESDGAATYACVFQFAAPDVPCSDDQCFTDQTCSAAGVCQGGTPLDCDDSDKCTIDTCAPATGCVHTNSAAACDDGNACSNDSCFFDFCKNNPIFSSTPVPCDDGNECTIGDACPVITCKPGQPCGSISPQSCKAGTIIKDCDDGNPCNVDACPLGVGACTHEDKACDDGDNCTANDIILCDNDDLTCQGSPVACDDGNPCTTDACNSFTGGCDFEPIDGCVPPTDYNVSALAVTGGVQAFQALSWNVTVQNTGAVIASGMEIVTLLSVDAVVDDNDYVLQNNLGLLDNVGEGQLTTKPIAISKPLGPAGDIPTQAKFLCVRIAYDQDPTPQNNTKCVAITVFSPDLEVVNISLTTAQWTWNSDPTTYTANVTVRNIGNLSGNVLLSAYFADDLMGLLTAPWTATLQSTQIPATGFEFVIPLQAAVATAAVNGEQLLCVLASVAQGEPPDGAQANNVLCVPVTVTQ